MELLSRWSCWLCGMKRVPTLPSECVPEIGDPFNNYMPLNDATLCPGCACSNPDDVVDCVGCGDGIEMLTGYNPYSARHPVPSFARRH